MVTSNEPSVASDPEKGWRKGAAHSLSSYYVPIYYSIQSLRQPHEMRIFRGGDGRSEKSGGLLQVTEKVRDEAGALSLFPPLREAPGKKD